ncbi:asparagine synthase (glutamine-hydrolyzing) [Pontibacter sp. MBLB2868]|uniref:asparagine synthase (glutamine-hydrolyzing) n=1 Tax=Pontibacter sp. MBLB2868 TaxID=3451555 RepID=UPI003F74BFEA
MCGLTGVFAFSESGKVMQQQLQAASGALQHRGPDAAGLFLHGPIGLAHRRLSIIAPSPNADQPFTDPQGCCTIVLNGEIFNYQKLREELQVKGVQFTTSSDTEVVLQLYKREGQEFLKKLRGFFALAIYDSQQQSLFLARDRSGEKPLLYYKDADRFMFGSELGALFELGVPRELDYTSLYQYLQLTYVPAPASMIKGVKKLLPGHSLLIKNGKVHNSMWYRLPFDPEKASHNLLTYKQQQAKLRQLMEQAVSDRLVADVPVGAFLSGGIDSSVVVALASKQVEGLKTFSVGFPEQPYYDETQYARLVARKYNTKHTEVLLTGQELYDNLFSTLDHFSEPFADSSALAVYALSKHVGQELKAALSGDGADELFGGYNKHLAEYKVLAGGGSASAVKQLKFLWDVLPKSRNSFTANKVRQLQRFAEGANLPIRDRYWFWATWQKETEALMLLKPENRSAAANRLYFARKSRLLDCLDKKPYSINSVLCADWNLVLANDMLPKIDLMGMANGLEIRSPFLDHRVVKFAFSLPDVSKIEGVKRKRILLDTFNSVLPPELTKRGKQGFEVPLNSLLRVQAKDLVNDLLADDFILRQGVFEMQQVRKLRNDLLNGSSATAYLQIWSILVFQYWWKKYMAE